MADATSQKVVQAIDKQMSIALGSKLDGSFSVIRYPPGYNFNVQYHMPVYFNPHTAALIDELCSVDGNGVVSLTGARFSTLYAQILSKTAYHVSSTDAASNALEIKAFNKQGDEAVRQFEKSFGRISQKLIAASGCAPPTKTGYMLDYVSKYFPGNPPNIPFAYANFSAAYTSWMAMGAQLEKTGQFEQQALNKVKAARAHTVDPAATNGGVQTSDSTWSVAYTGLPDNNSIVASLTDPNRKAAVKVDMQSTDGQTMRIQVDNKDVGAAPNTDLRITVTDPQNRKSMPVDNLMQSATKIEMEILYTGLTVLRTDPVELSANLDTGWFSRSILSDVATKTGHDVTGLYLQGSTFSVDTLFGPGNMLGRVKTFVISQEPTITLKLHGVQAQAAAAQFKTSQAAQIDLGDVLTFGSTGSGAIVHTVNTQGSVTIVTLGPSTPVGTTPGVDQTAHIIGGVVDWPP